MLCQSCFGSAEGLLCSGCRSRLRPAPDRILDNGLRVVAAFAHEGPARVMVHHLKYRGVMGYAELVARILAPSAPRLPMVPIPRAWSRRVRYGVDPALEITRRLATLVGVPVWPLLRGPLHRSRRAGGSHSRPVEGLGLRRTPSSPVVLVDDVVTTGSTMTTAAGLIGLSQIALCMAANAADKSV